MLNVIYWILWLGLVAVYLYGIYWVVKNRNRLFD